MCVLNKQFEFQLTNDKTNKIMVSGGFALFIAVLQNKAILKDVLEDDFVFNLWNRCRFTEAATAKDREAHFKLLVLIFEHVSNNQFKRVVQHLMTVMVCVQ